MNIAIVELRESHEECIYTQLRFLKDEGHQVTLILNPVLASQISDYANFAYEVIYWDAESPSLPKKIKSQWDLFLILKKFEKIILNTAHSYSVMRNLSVLLRFAETECIGVLHDTKKLQTSFTQSIISKKVKKYLVLNDDLIPENQNLGSIRVQSFYPIFFPEYEPVPVYKQNEIWIGIPGRLDYRRRNYDLLIDALKRIPDLERVKFIVLGKVDRREPFGKRFYQSLEDSGLLPRFKLFHSFIDNADFHTYLKACDYIMPLLHINESYFESKISGAFNLAFAYKKPLICHRAYKEIPDLKANSLFFDAETLHKLIVDIDLQRIESPATYADPKWTYRFQQKRYIDFVMK